MSKPVELIVASCEQSGCEAIYLDGELEFADISVYASDIAGCMKTEVIRFRHVTCLVGGDFPPEFNQLDFTELVEDEDE